MNKAILVMDMPENGCQDCYICKSSLFKTICGITGNDVSGNHERGGFPEECPLNPMPEKAIGINYLDNTFQHPAFDHGWNTCIDEICKSANSYIHKNEICPVESITASEINVSNFKCIPVFKSDNDPTDE